MEKYYLAIDIGASSGRHMLAHMQDGRMVLEEIYRFDNGMVRKNGALCWDLDRLFSEILTGLKKCRELGKIPTSVSVDTWGVDFVLLDEQDHLLGDAVGYRDARTNGMDQKVYETIPEDVLYRRTGIQRQIYNTIFQLEAVKQAHPEYLEQAKTLLMLPDYFHFLLSGVKKNEYTIATTGQLVDPKTGDWDYDLMRTLGFPTDIFLPLSMPGTVVGDLRPEVQAQVGFHCSVILPASHDTGSAVLAVPSNEEGAVYISSGTWSLMGIEKKEPDCSPESMAMGFTNEGGYDHRYRYLKNIMGLWMIQSVRKEQAPDLSYEEICEMASKETIASLVDCNDEVFLAPESMTVAVQDYCEKTNQEVPRSIGELGAVIYNSLAKCYGDTIRQIEGKSGRTCETVYVVGGGSNAVYLNELTAKYTGKTVSAGPAEATAIGNCIVQMLTDGVFTDLKQARAVVDASFGVQKYRP